MKMGMAVAPSVGPAAAEHGKRAVIQGFQICQNRVFFFIAVFLPIVEGNGHDPAGPQQPQPGPDGRHGAVRPGEDMGVSAGKPAEVEHHAVHRSGFCVLFHIGMAVQDYLGVKALRLQQRPGLGRRLLLDVKGQHPSGLPGQTAQQAVSRPFPAVASMQRAPGRTLCRKKSCTMLSVFSCICVPPYITGAWGVTAGHAVPTAFESGSHKKVPAANTAGTFCGQSAVNDGGGILGNHPCSPRGRPRGGPVRLKYSAE